MERRFQITKLLTGKLHQQRVGRMRKLKHVDVHSRYGPSFDTRLQIGDGAPTCLPAPIITGALAGRALLVFERVELLGRARNQQKQLQGLVAARLAGGAGEFPNESNEGG